MSLIQAKNPSAITIKDKTVTDPEYPGMTPHRLARRRHGRVNLRFRRGAGQSRMEKQVQANTRALNMALLDKGFMLNKSLGEMPSG